MTAVPIRTRIIVALHDAECSEQRCDIATFAKHYGPQADAVLAVIPDPAEVPTTEKEPTMADPITTAAELDPEDVAHSLWAHVEVPFCGSADCIYADGERDADYECNCPECWAAALRMAEGIIPDLLPDSPPTDPAQDDDPRKGPWADAYYQGYHDGVSVAQATAPADPAQVVERAARVLLVQFILTHPYSEQATTAEWDRAREVARLALKVANPARAEGGAAS